jgi:hypothetical protein
MAFSVTALRGVENMPEGMRDCERPPPETHGVQGGIWEG